MNQADILSRVSKILGTPLNSKTAALKALDSILGTLSKPSKMPGYGWSINASHCKTGSKLAEQPNTPCSMCYARKGRYQFYNTRLAMSKRLMKYIALPNWSTLMALRLNLIGDRWFRWFDSGDLQGTQMLVDICRVASLTPEVEHWLPTQERAMVSDYMAAHGIPSNIVIRVSLPKLDSDLKSATTPISSVGNTESGDIYQCPSREHSPPHCGECRACWDGAVRHVRYAPH